MKRITLWQYEDLIKKLIVLKAYPVLWQAYKQDMSQSANFARRLFPYQNIEAGEYPARVLYMMERLKSDKISKWDDLFPSVATRSDCEAFVSDHKLKFEEFIDLLNYRLRWAFPFQRHPENYWATKTCKKWLIMECLNRTT